jgi:hypothetical protein
LIGLSGLNGIGVWTSVRDAKGAAALRREIDRLQMGSRQALRKASGGGADLICDHLS